MLELLTRKGAVALSKNVIAWRLAEDRRTSHVSFIIIRSVHIILPRIGIFSLLIPYSDKPTAVALYYSILFSFQLFIKRTLSESHQTELIYSPLDLSWRLSWIDQLFSLFWTLNPFFIASGYVVEKLLFLSWTRKERHQFRYWPIFHSI